MRLRPALTRVPSGVTANIDFTSDQLLTQVSLSTLHTLALVIEPLMKCCPSGVAASETTCLECPLMVRTACHPF